MAKKPPSKPITRQYEYMGREARRYAASQEHPVDISTKVLKRKVAKAGVQDTWSNYRKDFPNEEPRIKELKNSIKRSGFDPSKPIYASYKPGEKDTSKQGWPRKPGHLTIGDGNHRFLAAQDLKLKRVPIQIGANNLDYNNEPPMIKDKTGRDPYNTQRSKVMAKKKGGSGRKGGGKTPDWKKPSPNNPYNNASSKVKASSRGQVKYPGTTDYTNVDKAEWRELQRRDVMSERGWDRKTNPVQKAGEGMARKNAQARGVTDYKRVVGATPGQFSAGANMQSRPIRAGWDKQARALKNGASPKSKVFRAAKSGVSDYARYNDAKSRMGQRGMLGKGDAQARLKNAAGVGIGAAAAGKVGLRAAFTNPVVGSGVTAFAIASAANKKFGISRKIVDKIAPKYDPGVYRTNKSSGQAYKVPAKKKKR